MKVQISTRGGVRPRWAPDGRELFFIGQRSAARLEYVPAFRVITIETLFPLPDDVPFGRASDTYDVGPDGRFLMVRNLTSAQDSRHILVLNALEHLRAPR